ncbi:preprotein translocase, SecE subunit [Dorea sp. 5-2]|jgi:preprotein translocase subunit SecE|nr:preprotein translocase, SecE subunit [Dorea sp. 5-2]MCI9025377.1 preprotein translocase subunit SecE [Dorea sp.]
MSEKTQKQSWFKGVSNEFKKIIWSDKKTVAKQTAAVVVVSVMLGVIIAIVDFASQYGVDLLVR